jgi:hypothetical protein
MNPWVIGGGAALLLLLATRGAKAALPGYDERDTEERDLDALADMLITETGFNRDRSEMAQIVFVAVNRARKYRKPIYSIVDPSGRAPAWNAGAPYRQRFEAAQSNSRWGAARAFAQDVLSGAYRNMGHSAFVHPGGMPTPPCSSTRVATNTGYYGIRCLPQWAVGGKVVGGAMFA